MRIDLSLINCHVKGLHSLVLTPGPQMRRIFFTTPDHEMHSPDAVAIHQHHCDLWLVPLFGEDHIANWTPTELKGGTLFRGWQFESAIQGKGGAFRQTERRREFYLLPRVLKDPIRLAASDLHTVTVSEGQRAAWLVLEGLEDGMYDSTAWSTRDLSGWTVEGLYRPMSAQFLTEEFPTLAAVRSLVMQQESTTGAQGDTV